MIDSPAAAPQSAPAPPPAKQPRRVKRGIPHWAHTPIYGAVRTAAAAINLVGPELSMRLMRRVGATVAALPMNKMRLNRAIENIAWCFPDWSPEQTREYAIESYRHLFCLGAEVAVTPRLLSEDGFAAHVEVGDLGSGLKALCSDRPSLLITGHCGNWELLGYSMALLGFPMHALYRPLDMKPLDAWLLESRSRRGLTLVDKFGAAAELPRLMRHRAPVGFIADQNAGDRGIQVPFFNRLASAYKTIGLLAMRFGANIICGHARRLSGLSASESLSPRTKRGILPAAPTLRESQAFRYRLDVIDVYGPDDWANQPDPLFYITARYRRAIEIMVRRAPEQYLWMHRYWKSRPPHERRGKPFPSQLREKIASLPWIDDDDVHQIVERSAFDTLHYQKRGTP